MDDPGHIESWTADEVATFLTKLELEQYSDDFVGNEITGDILIHLDHEALRDIGVESVGHRLNILRAVYNIKISDNVTFEPEHYVPATVDFENINGSNVHDLQKDLVAITQAIQLRGERLLAAEAEIKRLTDNLTRLKDQISPVIKIVKELQPLPTPDVGITQTTQGGQSLSRKFSTKKLFLGSAPKQPSPTHTPPAYLQYNEPESPNSPSRYTDNSSNPPGSSHSHTPTSLNNLPTLMESPGLGQQHSIQRSQLPPPPRPPPPGVTPLITKREQRQEFSDSSSSLATPQSGNPVGSSGNSTLDAFKSFRVGLDDPCSKVLPVALKKYRINSDWREYSLFICYADQERCLGLDEKPLLVFQELQRANKNPVFMLRKLESGTTSILPVRGSESEMRF